MSPVAKVMQSNKYRASVLYTYGRVAYGHWANGVFTKGQAFPALTPASGHERIISSGMCAQTFLNSASGGGKWPSAHVKNIDTIVIRGLVHIGAGV
jgi:hypothetical protein